MECNNILGIQNRTENWKTARIFSPLITNDRQHMLAEWIVRNATKKPHSFEPSEVHIELFWKGFRDYCKLNKTDSKNKEFIEKTAARYNSLFLHLREQIEQYNCQVNSNEPALNPKKTYNYVCDLTPESLKRLYNNLFNTEVDVVLSTPGFLLISEAKHTQTFGADSKHVLVHQLVRQYVMASILVEIAREEQPQRGMITVIPFIIGNNVGRSAQVRLSKVFTLSVDGYASHLNEHSGAIMKPW